MLERVALLNLVAELRGRLDELESLIRMAPSQAILTPASYDEDGVVDLTPPGYRDFRRFGLSGHRDLTAYEPLMDFTQFGAPPEATGLVVRVSAFDLSDLHRVGPDPAFGLRFTPRGRKTTAWFTYEFRCENQDLAQCVWLEWVLKLSTREPVQCFVRIMVEGVDYAEPIDVGNIDCGNFAAFHHIRLDRTQILQATGGRAFERLRLTLSTGEKPVDMDLFSLALFGRL